MSGGRLTSTRRGTSGRTTRSVVATVVGVLAMLLAGCTASYDDTPLPSATQPPTTAPTSAGPSSQAPACRNALASYDPSTSGSQPSVAKIKKRGKLIAGVSADTFLLGSRNPINGRIEGFDIDMVEMVADAVLGDPNAYELRVITAAQRIDALKNHEVDIVARNMTINCDRWTQIAFSAEYYRSGQKLLATRGSKIKGLADLNGRRVCAPRGTSSLVQIQAKAPKAEIVPADTHTGCLVLFQQGKVDVITGDDTVLAGLVAQDPYAQVVAGAAFTAEPYGLGVAPDQVDLVRFVNAALAEMKSSGQWASSYNQWLAPSLGKAPTPPRAVYGRNA